MNKTIFIAAMLAVATVLAAGLAVLPGSVQEAQANPCSVTSSSESSSDGDENVPASSAGEITHNGDQNCDFTGPVEFDED